MGERSWCPEDDSHEAFKSLIVESFASRKFKTLTHVAHDLARRCVQWFGTPDANTYTVAILIIQQKDFAYHSLFNEVWGSYAEYQINHDCIMVFKDGLREGEGPTKQLEQCLDLLKKQKNCILQIVNQGDGVTDMPLVFGESKSVVKIPQAKSAVKVPKVEESKKPEQAFENQNSLKFDNILEKKEPAKPQKSENEKLKPLAGKPSLTLAEQLQMQ